MSKIQAKECQNVEYKRGWKDEYLKWICGFANAQGAVMYFGVDDDLEVCGLKDAKRLLEDIPNFIEAWGRGYEKIHDAFKKEELEQPVFEEVRGGFMATIKRERFVRIRGERNVPSIVPSIVPSNVTSDVTSFSIVQLSERQRKICELIRKNPWISAQEMSLVLSVVIRTIRRDLVALQKKGVLLREGNTSAGRWVLLSI